MRECQKKVGIRGMGSYGVVEKRFSVNNDSLYPFNSGGKDKVLRL